MKRLFILILISAYMSAVSAQSYEDRVNEAMDMVDKKDYSGAEKAFKEALRQEPANPVNTMVIANLGTVLRHLGKLDEALISYNVTIEKYPKVSFLRHNRAKLYCEMGLLNEALIDYNTILASDTSDIEALYQRGLVYISLKNIFSAEDDFEKINKIKAGHPLAKMGNALVLKQQNQWEDAEKVYTELIGKDSENAELFFFRAECLLRMEKLARAQSDIAKALELGLDSPSIYILRGHLRLSQYDKKMAENDFLKARDKGAEPTIIEELLKKCK